MIQEKFFSENHCWKCHFNIIFLLFYLLLPSFLSHNISKYFVQISFPFSFVLTLLQFLTKQLLPYSNIFHDHMCPPPYHADKILLPLVSLENSPFIIDSLKIHKVYQMPTNSIKNAVTFFVFASPWLSSIFYTVFPANTNELYKYEKHPFICEENSFHFSKIFIMQNIPFFKKHICKTNVIVFYFSACYTQNINTP